MPVLGSRLLILILSAVEFSLVFNPLSPRVKPWMIQSFLTFDSTCMDRTRKCDHSLKSYCTLLWCCLFFLIVNLALSGVKGLMHVCVILLQPLLFERGEFPSSGYGAVHSVEEDPAIRCKK